MSYAWQNGPGLKTQSGKAQGDSRGYNGPIADPNVMHSAGDSQPISKGQIDEINKLAAYFGKPANDRLINMESWDSYEKENSDYPEAFGKLYGNPDDPMTMSRNGHMSRVLIEKSLASQCWPITRMAPWKRHMGSLTFDWDVARYNKHMLDRVPEEALPRLLSSTRSGGRASMVRFGLAMLLEVGFMNTPLGRQTYLMNFEQIRVATVETCSYGAVITIMEWPPAPDMNAQWYPNSEMNVQAINAMFQDECDMWGKVHKDRDGYETVLSKLRETLNARSSGAEVHPKFTVLPQGMAKYLDSAERKFYIDGPGTDAQIEASINNKTIVESRTFSQGEHMPGHDPMFRHQTIGGFMTMDDLDLSGQDAKDYKTEHMDTYGWDESMGSYYRFRYKRHYKYAGLWAFDKPSAELTSEIGRGYMHDYGCYTHGQLIRKGTCIEKVVDGLYNLVPEKRQEFLNTLQMLPADDPRVVLSNGDEYPEANEDSELFDANKFDAMCSGEVEFDKQYSIPEQQRLTHKRTRGLYDASEETAEFEEWRAKKLKGDREDTRTLQDRYDQADDTNDVVMDEDTYVDNGDSISLIAGQARTTRRVRRKVLMAPDTGVRKVGTSDLAKLVKDTLALTDKCNVPDTKSKTDTDAALKQDKECRVAVEAWTNEIQTKMQGATIQQRVTLLTELKRVVRGEIARIKTGINGDPKNKVTDKALTGQIVACFTPFLATMQTRVVLEGIRVHKTTLESHMASNPGTDLGDVGGSSIAKQGWWNPYTGPQPPAASPADLKAVGTRLDALQEEREKSKDNEATIQEAMGEITPPSPQEGGATDESNLAQQMYEGTIKEKRDQLSTARAHTKRFQQELDKLNETYRDMQKPPTEQRQVEDGHIMLMSGSDSPPIPLPHDSYAITLAAHHTVLFHLDDSAWAKFEANGYTLDLVEASSRDRTDALAWSAFVSAMIYQIGVQMDGNAVVKLDHVADLTVKNTSSITKQRLVRVAEQFNKTRKYRPNLPSQLHLANLLHVIEESMRTALKVDTEKIAGINTTPRDTWINQVGVPDVGTIDGGLMQDVIDNGYTEKHAPTGAPVDTRFDEELIALLGLPRANRTTYQNERLDAVRHVIDMVGDGDAAAQMGYESMFAHQGNDSLKKLMANTRMSTDEREAKKKEIQCAIKDMNIVFGLLKTKQTPKSALVTTPLSSGGQTPFSWSKAFITSQIDRASLASGKFIEFCVDNNVPVVFFLRLWRPNKTYNMGSILQMDDDAAITFYQDPNFMMAEDAGKKMIFGHFTFYSKTIVLYPEKIVIGKNVFCNKYIGGNGIGVWNPLSVYDLEAFREGDMIRDIFVTYGLMKRAETTTVWLSFTGKMPTSISCTEEVSRLMAYEGATAVSTFWGFRTDARNYARNQAYQTMVDPNERRYNVVCFQDFQLKYNPCTELFDTVKLNRGHWGANSCCPGGELVTRGSKAYFDIPTYAATKTMTLV